MRLGQIAILSFLLFIAAFHACGCGNAEFMRPERMEKGLIIILPGIEGQSHYNEDIRQGLLAAGIDQALEVYPWGAPIPIVGTTLNQVNVIGNWITGKAVADHVVDYKKKYPDRPVHVIGHSGGGGIAVFAAAQMPPDVQIDGVILLHASISCDYDITDALCHSGKGIANFFNPDDTGLLGVGTTIMGNIDGGRSPSAGRVGFSGPKENAKERTRNAYIDKLHEVSLAGEVDYGTGPHGVATSPVFVSLYLSLWIRADSWPPHFQASASSRY